MTEKKRKGGGAQNDWKPGQSGNPGGRPKEGAIAARRIRHICAKFGEEAIETIVEVMRNKEELGKTRIYAAELLLNRAFGKPDVDKAGGEPESQDVINPQQADRVLALLQHGALAPREVRR
jgi:hypothetical protein